MILICNFNTVDFGKTIRKERLKREWSQKELSKLTGISTSRISSIEKGTSAIGVNFLLRFSEAFALPVDYLLTGVVSDNTGRFIEHEILDCNELELTVITETVKAIKKSLREAKAG